MSKSPQVTAKLGLDNSSLRSGLAGSQRSIDKFGSYARKSLTTAFKGATIAGGALVAQMGYGLHKQMQIENAQIALKSFMGSADKAKKAVAMLRKEVSDRPIFDVSSMMSAGKALSTYAKGDISKLQELVEMAQKLSVLNPEQGLEGAAFSLKEALSGDYVSLIERFNVSRSRINELKAMGLEGQQVVAKILSELGVSEATLDDFGNSFSGMLAQMRSSYEEFASTMAEGAFKEWKPKLQEFLGFLKEHEAAIQQMAGVAGAATMGMVEAAIAGFERLSVGFAGADAFFGSMRDSYQRGDVDILGSANAAAKATGSLVAAGAMKVNELGWDLLGSMSEIGDVGRITGFDKYAQKQSAWSNFKAREAWDKKNEYGQLSNRLLGTDKAADAYNEAAAAKASEFEKSTAKLGDRGEALGSYVQTDANGNTIVNIPEGAKPGLENFKGMQADQQRIAAEMAAKQAAINAKAQNYHNEWVKNNPQAANGAITPEQQRELQAYQYQMQQLRNEARYVEQFYARMAEQNKNQWVAKDNAQVAQQQQANAYNSVRQAPSATLNVNVASNGQVPLGMAAAP